VFIFLRRATPVARERAPTGVWHVARRAKEVVWRSRRILLPEPASLTNSLKICERCRLGIVKTYRSVVAK
jgi:hypothetical protein